MDGSEASGGSSKLEIDKWVRSTWVGGKSNGGITENGNLSGKERPSQYSRYWPLFLVILIIKEIATMAARKTKINKFYQLWATEHMIIDEDNDGLFYQLMSETEENNMYTVRVDESSTVPQVTSCNCLGHKDYGHICKHMIICTSFIRRIYKSTIAKLEAKEQVAQAEAELQAKRDQEKLAKAIAKQTPVAALPVITDLGKKGNLNVSRAFKIM